MARQNNVWGRVEELERLESLNTDISSSSALEERFRADELAGCIKEVCIRDVKEEAYKTLVLPTMERLNKLIIRSCEISEIEIGRTPWDIILTRKRLRNLTSVIITGCNGLKDLTWLLFVPNFTHLQLQCLEKVQEIISEEKVSSSVTDEPKARDFGLARVSFNVAPTAIFWTDYVATRWYRAPEICRSFFSKYTPAIDIWSVGCIFAEMLLGKPLFPGKNVVHQLDLMTDFLGTPPPESISKARRYLSSMRKKQPIPFSHKFPKADPLALRLLERLLAFDPKDRASAEDVPFCFSFPISYTDLNYYLSFGLLNSEREPSTQPISKLEFDFKRKKLTKDDILEYHPQTLEEYKCGGDQLSFMYPRDGKDEVHKEWKGEMRRILTTRTHHAILEEGEMRIEIFKDEIEENRELDL
ncbi:hypothetical protein Bca52824_062671 [Brassica carinata]|uniref:Protein kinase domain-containing protein n=1 Tax=Brassica carinata TaxID=52824 RepID=A0A8X7U9M6_BRACI|nr:hypothetical protein Bca52824_062671 [Brassica carinata]